MASAPASSSLSSTPTLVVPHRIKSRSLPAVATAPIDVQAEPADHKERKSREGLIRRLSLLPSPSASIDCRTLRGQEKAFPSEVSLRRVEQGTLASAAGLLAHLLKLRNADSYDIIYGLLYRGTLPTETIALGILILAKLSPDLYRGYKQESRFCVGRNRPEVIALACLMIAQKVLHDAPYTTATWSSIVAEDLLSRGDLITAERLVLVDLDYQFKDLATPRNLAAVVSVIKSGRGSNLVWQDVKIAILRSSQRGKTTQEASLATARGGGLRPRLENSGRRTLWRGGHSSDLSDLVDCVTSLDKCCPILRRGHRDPFQFDAAFFYDEDDDESARIESETWSMDRIAHTYPIDSS
jgi:hypothetical protein